MDLSDVGPRNADAVAFHGARGWLEPDRFWSKPASVPRSNELTPLFARRHRGQLVSSRATVHSEWELIAVQSGDGELLLHRCVKLRPGHVYLVPPHVAHSERAANVDLYWIALSGSAFSHLLCARHFELEAPASVGLAQRLWQIALQQSPGSGAELDGIARAIVGPLFSTLPAVEAKADDQPTTPVDAWHSVIREIERHYSRIESVAGLAARFGWSEGHFYREFRYRMGVSPMAFLTQVRLRAADSMLASGECLVAEVARAVGYRDALYFSRLYKKHRGCSPSGRLALKTRVT